MKHWMPAMGNDGNDGRPDLGESNPLQGGKHQKITWSEPLLQD